MNDDWNDDFEIPYPERGDKLIDHSRKQGEKRLFAAWMIGQWHWYPDAYKQAADKLVDQIEGHSHEDRLIFPIIFLYRHFVELKIKEIIIQLDRLSGTQIAEKQFKKHQLMPLWSYAREHLACINNANWDNDILPSLERMI